MARKYSILGLLMLICIVTMRCKKEKGVGEESANADIAAARSYFNDSILSDQQKPNSKNVRASQAKELNWDSARIISLPSEDAILVPVQYKKDLFISSPISGDIKYKLSDVTKLVLIRGSNHTYSYALITYMADSNAFNSNNWTTGIFFSEDWQGNSLTQPKTVTFGKSATNPKAIASGGLVETDVVQSYQVCNDVYGYNYSAEDPSNVYEWSETSCTTYGFNSNPSNSAIGPRLPPGFIVPRPTILTVALPPPTNPIGNIADYFGCFTAHDEPGYTYSVTLAVEQPSPGSRTPWSYSEVGLGGSLIGLNPLNVGHTWLIFTENAGPNTITRNVGFYPTTMVMPGSTTSQGVLNNDQNTSYNVCLSVNVSSTQFFLMTNYVEQGNNPGYMYNLNSNNCTTFAVDAMDQGGVSIPATVGSWGINSKGLDPGDLGEDIKSMQLSSNMKLSTVENPHLNTGVCN
jgi:hypothetical protein